jgi:hypothetical protein
MRGPEDSRKFKRRESNAAKRTSPIVASIHPAAELLQFGLVPMTARYSRPVLSTALSCWFGFHACLLGCAQPALAARQCDRAQTPSEHVLPASTDTGDRPCCNHGRNRSAAPGKNQHKSASCCPLDATLAQKRASVQPVSSSAHLAVLASFLPLSPSLLVANGELPPTSVWHAGRDILLQTHTLRI